MSPSEINIVAEDTEIQPTEIDKHVPMLTDVTTIRDSPLVLHTDAGRHLIVDEANPEIAVKCTQEGTLLINRRNRSGAIQVITDQGLPGGSESEQTRSISWSCTASRDLRPDDESKEWSKTVFVPDSFHWYLFVKPWATGQGDAIAETDKQVEAVQTVEGFISDPRYNSQGLVNAFS